MEVKPRSNSGVRCFWLVLACAMNGNAGAQSTTEQRATDRRWENHIYGTEPRRPTGPARRDNITDEEVREVQNAALSIYPDAIVNISTVTSGCECEERGSCTAQVWLVMYRPDRTRGLMLSKINGHWEVGAVQNWWLRYYELQGRRPSFSDGNRRAKSLAWQTEFQDLINGFPVCATHTE